MKDVKYKSVFARLRSEILLGKFDDCARFPSEGQLMRRFGVSRITVRLALAELKEAGMIETRLGSGTFLSPRARNSTGYLGLILPDYGSGEIFTPIAEGVSRFAAEAGYTLLFGSVSAADPDTRAAQALRLARDYAEKHVAGVIVEPVELARHSMRVTAELLEEFRSKRIPVVLIDRDIAPPPQRSAYDLVGIDNVQAAYRLASYLYFRGARDLRFFVRPKSAYTTVLRAQGIALAALDAGAKWKASHRVEGEPDDPRAVGEMFARGRRPDAIVCGNDMTAAALLKTLAALGLSVPGDVMVAGFDDVNAARIVSPALTTMRQPCEDLARAAVETLLQRVRQPGIPPRAVSLSAELVARESTR